MKKRRSYMDYRELGNLLCVATAALGSAYLKLENMFGRTRPPAQELWRLIKSYEKLKAELDRQYCQEIPETAVPSGDQRFPIYTGPPYYRWPECLNELLPEQVGNRSTRVDTAEERDADGIAISTEVP